MPSTTLAPQCPGRLSPSPRLLAVFSLLPLVLGFRLSAPSFDVSVLTHVPRPRLGSGFLRFLFLFFAGCSSALTVLMDPVFSNVVTLHRNAIRPLLTGLVTDRLLILSANTANTFRLKANTAKVFELSANSANNC